MAWNLGLLGAAGSAKTAFELIETITLSSAANSITFSSIPSTYKHLHLRFAIKESVSSSSGPLRVYGQLNNDATLGAYDSHRFTGDQSSPASQNAMGNTYFVWSAVMAGGNTDVPVFSVGYLDITDYASSVKNKTIRSFSGYPDATSRIEFGSGLWKNTSSVNSIKLFPEQNGFRAPSRFSLYGIKE